MTALAARLRFLWQHNRIALIAFALALMVAGGFAVNLTVAAIYWSAHREEAVQGWMTLGYVERSWGLPMRSLAVPLDMPKPSPDARGRPKTIAVHAAERGLTTAEFIGQIYSAIDTVRAQDRHQ